MIDLSSADFKSINRALAMFAQDYDDPFKDAKSMLMACRISFASANVTGFADCMVLTGTP